jgi:hypothetical protein
MRRTFRYSILILFCLTQVLTASAQSTLNEMKQESIRNAREFHRQIFAPYFITVTTDKETYYEGEYIRIHYLIECDQPRRFNFTSEDIWNFMEIESPNWSTDQIRKSSGGVTDAGQFTSPIALTHERTHSMYPRYDVFTLYDPTTRDTGPCAHLAVGQYTLKMNDFIDSDSCSISIVPPPDEYTERWNVFLRMCSASASRSKTQYTLEHQLDSIRTIGDYALALDVVGDPYLPQALDYALLVFNAERDHWNETDSLRCRDYIIKRIEATVDSVDYAEAWSRAKWTLFKNLDRHEQSNSLKAFAREVGNSAFEHFVEEKERRIVSEAADSE